MPEPLSHKSGLHFSHKHLLALPFLDIPKRMCVFLCCPGPYHCGRCVCVCVCVCVHECDLSLGIASAGSHEEQIAGDCSPSWQAPAGGQPTFSDAEAQPMRPAEATLCQTRIAAVWQIKRGAGGWAKIWRYLGSMPQHIRVNKPPSGSECLSRAPFIFYQ